MIVPPFTAGSNLVGYNQKLNTSLPLPLSLESTLLVNAKLAPITSVIAVWCRELFPNFIWDDVVLFGMLLNALGETSEGGEINEEQLLEWQTSGQFGCMMASADMNNDGMINLIDLNTMLELYELQEGGCTDITACNYKVT